MTKAPTARILDVTLEQYHADPCATPSLSQSLSHTMLTESPAHAYLKHPKLGLKAEEPDDPTAAMLRGTLTHKLTLGKGADVVIVEAKDWRTKAAQEAKIAALANGQVPVLAHVYAEVDAAVKAILAKLADRGIILDGQSEVAVEWTEEIDPERRVLCRAMLDHLAMRSAPVVYDLKTISGAHPMKCAARAYDMGYDIQAHAYRSAVRKLYPEHVGREDFVFIFAETTPPYAVTLARPNGEMEQLGRSRWERALLSWYNCLTFDKWPEYTEEIVHLAPPPWAMAKEMGMGEF